MKNMMFLMVFLLSGLAFSQTTGLRTCQAHIKIKKQTYWLSMDIQKKQTEATLTAAAKLAENKYSKPQVLVQLKNIAGPAVLPGELIRFLQVDGHNQYTALAYTGYQKEIVSVDVYLINPGTGQLSKLLARLNCQ